jgi:hypothetical protein
MVPDMDAKVELFEDYVLVLLWTCIDCKKEKGRKR